MIQVEIFLPKLDNNRGYCIAIRDNTKDIFVDKFGNPAQIEEWGQFLTRAASGTEAPILVHEMDAKKGHRIPTNAVPYSYAMDQSPDPCLAIKFNEEVRPVPDAKVILTPVEKCDFDGTCTSAKQMYESIDDEQASLPLSTAKFVEFEDGTFGPIVCVQSHLNLGMTYDVKLDPPAAVEDLLGNPLYLRPATGDTQTAGGGILTEVTTSNILEAIMWRFSVIDNALFPPMSAGGDCWLAPSESEQLDIDVGPAPRLLAAASTGGYLSCPHDHAQDVDIHTTVTLFFDTVIQAGAGLAKDRFYVCPYDDTTCGPPPKSIKGI